MSKVEESGIADRIIRRVHVLEGQSPSIRPRSLMVGWISPAGVRRLLSETYVFDNTASIPSDRWIEFYGVTFLILDIGIDDCFGIELARSNNR